MVTGVQLLNPTFVLGSLFSLLVEIINKSQWVALLGLTMLFFLFHMNFWFSKAWHRFAFWIIRDLSKAHGRLGQSRFVIRAISFQVLPVCRMTWDIYVLNHIGLLSQEIAQSMSKASIGKVSESLGLVGRCLDPSVLCSSIVDYI